MVVLIFSINHQSANQDVIKVINETFDLGHFLKFVVGETIEIKASHVFFLELLGDSQEVGHVFVNLHYHALFACLGHLRLVERHVVCKFLVPLAIVSHFPGNRAEL